MPGTEDIRARKGKRARNGNEPPAPIDSRTRRGVMIGGTVALICAAGLSFPSLYGLARTGGLPMWLAPLLPVSLDVYAYIAMWFADRVPTTHPARASALRNGWLALALTVACNFFDHFLTFAAAIISPLTRDILLSTVLALPPFIVGRVLHLRALADGNGSPAPAAEPGTGTPAKDGSKKTERQRQTALEPGNENTGTPQLPAADPAPPALNPAPAVASVPSGPGSQTPELPAVAGEAKGGTVTQINGNGRRSPRDWAALGMPYYRRFADENGQGPTASTFVSHLRDAYPQLPVPRSERAERNIRAAAEELLKAGDVEPDRELQVA